MLSVTTNVLAALTKHSLVKNGAVLVWTPLETTPNIRVRHVERHPCEHTAYRALQLIKQHMESEGSVFILSNRIAN